MTLGRGQILLVVILFYAVILELGVVVVFNVGRDPTPTSSGGAAWLSHR